MLYTVTHIPTYLSLCDLVPNGDISHASLALGSDRHGSLEGKIREGGWLAASGMRFGTGPTGPKKERKQETPRRKSAKETQKDEENE